ncbi:hypothetical protein HWV23_02330 [Natronomonas halophila]|uniref:hypothetical protein n=1 Tax=Natronomonas halophila TaxID=2747817 RepID=UPI0015B4EA3F|nr:hypothetical protein [Natronomonas halophila]QLD84593.1 hypothetical protein HWV23_02330 [Natronomonas halophila]
MSAFAQDQEWRFVDGLASPPRSIPQQWLGAGDEEPVTEGCTRTYPILVRAGVELAGVRADDGDLVDGPHRERSVIRVLYVTDDGALAHERSFDADRDGNHVTPESFVAKAAPRTADLDEVPTANRPLYSLVDTYDEPDGDPDEVIDRWEQRCDGAGVIDGC